MQNIKEEIHQKLLGAGRNLVKDKGQEFLTARKLSEASGCSIGTIYNQFSSMDDFVAEQNEITLRELADKLYVADYTNDSYYNLNLMIEIFTKFVTENNELWLLLYNFHLSRKDYKLPMSYKRRLFRLFGLTTDSFERLFPGLNRGRCKVVKNVLESGLFGLSALLASGSVDVQSGKNMCRIFVNTFLAGVTLLEKN